MAIIILSRPDRWCDPAPLPWRCLTHSLGRLVQGALAAAQLGTCTSYYIFVSRNVRAVMSASLGYCEDALPGNALLIPALIPLFAPLACVPSLRHLAVTNIL